MYTKFLNLSDVDLEKYGSYRLCYISNIEELVYDPIESEDDWIRRSSPWVPNPEYICGERELWAFFTPQERFDSQWGDDWNDAPYEHNAGYPYDDYKEDGDEDWKEYEILMVAFGTTNNMWIKLPSDYGCGNSPFSVEDINSGAVAWLYGKDSKRTLCIHGGDSLEVFKKKLGD